MCPKESNKDGERPREPDLCGAAEDTRSVQLRGDSLLPTTFPQGATEGQVLTSPLRCLVAGSKGMA